MASTGSPNISYLAAAILGGRQFIAGIDPHWQMRISLARLLMSRHNERLTSCQSGCHSIGVFDPSMLDQFMNAKDQALHEAGVLRFLTCGSVDDGKSTLIGRLLHDARAILADTLAHITRASQRRGMDIPDLSMITDGLSAEREQGITIDVAYRYFTSDQRKFIIADSPGHEQYTRNMVTAASTADAAVLLLDVRSGMTSQTRRHAYLAHLLGIHQQLYVINKMDLVGYEQATFDKIAAQVREFTAQLPGAVAHILPASALMGDMVVDRGEAMLWYAGPTILSWLEQVPLPHEGNEPFRFPVQYVARGAARGYLGRVASGSIAVGDEVLVLPSGQQARVAEIVLLDKKLTNAVAEQSVTLLLDRQVDVSRGDMLVKKGGSPASSPTVSRQCSAVLCWLSQTPLNPARRYLLRHTTRTTPTKVEQIVHTVDINTLTFQPTQEIRMNDIAEVTLRLAQPMCLDTYATSRATGACILIDETSNNTVGAVMIKQVQDTLI